MSVKISSLNTASTIDSGDDINIAGNNPLTFSDWGGGWFMQDGTYIRSLNQKSIWLGDGVLASNGGLSVGYGGALPTAGYAIIAGALLIGTTSTTNTAAGKIVNRLGGTSNPDLVLNGGAWSIASIGGEPALYLSSNIVAATGIPGATQTAKGGMGFEYSSATSPTDLVLGIFGTPTVASSVKFFNNTERMRITSAGNVGIGTTSPARKLTIQGDDDATMQLRLQGTASTTSYWELGRESLSSGQFRFIASRNGTIITPMAIGDVTGNVMINTTTDAGYKLDVNGTARVSGMFTINNGYTNYQYSGSNYYATGLGFSSNYNYSIYNTNYGREDLKIEQATGAATFSSILNAKAGSYINGVSNSDWGFSVENTGTTNANGLYVNIGASSTGIPFRVDKGGSSLFSIANSGAATFSSSVTATDAILSNIKPSINFTLSVNPAFSHSIVGENYSSGAAANNYMDFKVANAANTQQLALRLFGTGAATFSSSVTATNFIGAGTGLTGTASGLSIGGSAGSVGGIAASRIVYGGVGARQGVTQITDWNQSSFPNAAFLSSEGSIANAPTTDFTYGVQTSFHRSGPDYRTQFVTSLYGNNVYWLRQLRDTAGWSSWVQVIHSGNIGSQSVSYATTAGALTSMNISQFTNDSGYITSGALTAYLPLAGGTMTGSITSNSVISTSSNIISTGGYISAGGIILQNNYIQATVASGGFWNSNHDVRFYPSAGNIWNITGATLGGSSFALRFLDAYNAGSGAVKAQIFWSASNVGLFNDQNDWVIKANQGASYGGTLYGAWIATGSITASANSVISGAVNSAYGLSVTNTGTTNAAGLYVNLGASATGVPFRVDKNGSALFDLTNAGNATIKGALTISGSNLYINSSAADISSRYNNGTNNYGWLLSTGTGNFSLFDYNSEAVYMQINPSTFSSNFYYANFNINVSNTSGGSITFKAAAAANNWSISKNDTTGLSINKNGVSQLGISATGATTLIGSLSVTGDYISVGSKGLYSSTDIAYFRRNDVSNFCPWLIDGAKSGNDYKGTLYNVTNLPHMMFNATGGGLYYQTGGRWVIYYDYTANCLAIGGSGVDATYKLRVTGAIYATGAIVANSDGRNKENVEVVENALEKVTNLRGVTYTKKDEDSGRREMGVIAQEVEPHVPEVVHYSKGVDVYGVSYGNFAGLFIEAIKEQQVLINELKAEIEILKNK